MHDLVAHTARHKRRYGVLVAGLVLGVTLLFAGERRTGHHRVKLESGFHNWS